ncbi:hypothetical protein BDN70DRAFT_920720 [Pholiota conissans]|uniref:Uncharacterized protein n=1 Tax=Pholiota conissans TaxID=109636 RepID=A0A9P6D1A5_9AGAR|nr:hypothetical protein BDN70DRAFT_920720 [Pholiota conissans]
MTPTIMGMDPLSFSLAVFSAIGALFSILTYLRQIVPTSKFLQVMDMLIETRSLWKQFEKESSLSDKQMDQFFDIMDSLEDDVESYIFISQPSFNVIWMMRAWFSTFGLARVGEDVDKLRVGLLTLNTQRSTIERSKKRMGRPDAPLVNLVALEKRYISTANAFIASFGDRKPKRPREDDVENYAEPDSESSIRYTPISPPIPLPPLPNRKPDVVPLRRVRRPISARSSISLNASRETLIASEPLLHKSPHPQLRFPHMGYSTDYSETKLD